jgi:hypothetical protein
MSEEAIDPAALLKLINAAPAGKRPWFFENRDVERLLNIVLAMAGELAVTRERLDTVERLLAQRELLPRAAIDAYRPDGAAAAERGAWQVDYLARLFRVLQQEVERMQRGAAEPSAEDLAREVGAT